MEDLIKFIKIDIIIQRVLLFLTCASVVVFYFLPVMLCILGSWQLISALIIRSRLKDTLRKKYLIFSVSYLILMWLAFEFMDILAGFSILILVIQIIVNPIVIAMWYFIQTKMTLKDLRKKGIITVPLEMEDILDSEEIFKLLEK